MKKLLPMFLALAILCGSVGCHSVTKHDGSWSVKWVTGLEFDSSVKKSDEAVATVGFELDDWLKGGVLGLMFGMGKEEAEADDTVTPEVTDRD